MSPQALQIHSPANESAAYRACGSAQPSRPAQPAQPGRPAKPGKPAIQQPETLSDSINFVSFGHLFYQDLDLAILFHQGVHLAQTEMCQTDQNGPSGTEGFNMGSAPTRPLQPVPICLSEKLREAPRSSENLREAPRGSA